MATLALIPATITVTNLKSEVIPFGRVPTYPGIPVDVPMAGRGDGDKSDVYQHLYSAEQAGVVDAGGLTVLTDPVPSGHTVFDGVNDLGAIGTDTLP